MKSMVRIATGVGLIAAGMGLIYIGFNADWFLCIVGLLISGLGIAILLNKDEDAIEEITTTKEHHE